MLKKLLNRYWHVLPFGVLAILATLWVSTALGIGALVWFGAVGVPKEIKENRKEKMPIKKHLKRQYLKEKSIKSIV